MRQKALTILFRDHYYDLLTAIASKSYEQLELLCEDRLTEALAACIYEVTEINKQTFGISKSGNQFSCEILNHFFVQNMHLQRSHNKLSIKHYQVKEKAGTLIYELKKASDL